MLTAIKRNDKQEAAARWFFLPLDREFNRVRIEIEREERKVYSRQPENFYACLWQERRELEILSRKQQSIFFSLMPIFHKIRGDEELTRLCLKALIGENIEIKYRRQENIDLSETTDEGLGDERLGVNFILGDVVYVEEYEAVVHVGPVEINNLTEFLPGGEKLAVLDLLYSYFFPVELDVVTKIIPKEKYDTVEKKKKVEKDVKFTLTSNNDNFGRLGYTSII